MESCWLPDELTRWRPDLRSGAAIGDQWVRVPPLPPLRLRYNSLPPVSPKGLRMSVSLTKIIDGAPAVTDALTNSQADMVSRLIEISRAPSENEASESWLKMDDAIAFLNDNAGEMSSLWAQALMHVHLCCFLRHRPV